MAASLTSLERCARIVGAERDEGVPSPGVLDPPHGALDSINVTLDGCVDHQEGIADDETHAFFTRLMDEGGAMLSGRVTYETMESYSSLPYLAIGVMDPARLQRRRAKKARQDTRPAEALVYSRPS
jgi:hypothetical protein